MNDQGLITMSLREADRFKVIQATAEGLLPQWRAAERLNLTTRQVHRYIEVAEYPDGRVELWADGAFLPYTTYDRFPEVDQGAIVDNKRLGHTLEIAAWVQA